MGNFQSNGHEFLIAVKVNTARKMTWFNITLGTSCACLSSEPAPAANDDAVDTNDAVEPCTVDNEKHMNLKVNKIIY